MIADRICVHLYFFFSLFISQVAFFIEVIIMNLWWLNPLSNLQLEGDGRIVPATDDELIEVESLHIDEKCEMLVVADPGQTVGCISNEGSSSGIAQLESMEGFVFVPSATL